MKWINKKTTSFFFHSLNGGVWIIILLGARVFETFDVKTIIKVQAIFVISSFALSLGMGTSVRRFIYDARYDEGYDIRNITVFVSLVCGVFYLIFEYQYLDVVFFASVYNIHFIRLLASIASKEYISASFSGATCAAIVFLTVFDNFYPYYDKYFFVIIILFFLLGLRGCVNKSSGWRRYFFIVKESLSFALAAVPIRVIAFSLGVYFSSDSVDSSTTLVYADMLVFFGVYTFIAGRVILFNEQEIVSNSTYNSRLLIVPALAYVSFVIYTLVMYGFSLTGLFVPLYFISREPYNLSVTFATENVRAYFIYSGIVISITIWLIASPLGGPMIIIYAMLIAFFIISHYRFLRG